jgi:hypothetical protein
MYGLKLSRERGKICIRGKVFAAPAQKLFGVEKGLRDCVKKAFWRIPVVN